MRRVVTRLASSASGASRSARSKGSRVRRVRFGGLAAYSSELRGSASGDSLASAALLQAGRQAIVDDPGVVSLFEAETSSFDRPDGTRSVDETVVVLR